MELSTMKYGDRFEMVNMAEINGSQISTMKGNNNLVYMKPPIETKDNSPSAIDPRTEKVNYINKKVSRGKPMRSNGKPPNNNHFQLKKHVNMDDLNDVSIWHFWPMNFANIGIAIIDGDHSNVNPNDIAPTRRHYYAREAGWESAEDNDHEDLASNNKLATESTNLNATQVCNSGDVIAAQKTINTHEYSSIQAISNRTLAPPTVVPQSQLSKTANSIKAHASQLVKSTKLTPASIYNKFLH